MEERQSGDRKFEPQKPPNGVRPEGWVREESLLTSIFIILAALFACQCISAERAFADATLTAEIRICVEREARRELNEAIKAKDENRYWGYPIEIENDIISICAPQTAKETVQDNMYTKNAIYIFINTRIGVIRDVLINQYAKQFGEMIRKEEKEDLRKKTEEERRKSEEDAARRKAWKEAVDKTRAAYLNCLEDHARIMAVNSGEPAQVIVEASFASCSTEKQTLFETYIRYDNSIHEDDMSMFMDSFNNAERPSMLLEVIKARAHPVASPSPLPTPAPTKTDTPI